MTSSDIIMYALGVSVSIIIYFLKAIHGEIKEQDKRLRYCETKLEKQGAENTAIFERLGELRECIQNLNNKFDKMIQK
jgi:predicted RNase H-like nuclease (RuvC/YqgF family)